MGNTMQIAGISSRRSSVRFGLAVVVCVAMLSGCNGGDNDQTISPALQETTGSAGNTPSSDIVASPPAPPSSDVEASPSKPLEAPVIQVQESNDLGKPVIFSVLPSVNAPINLRYLWDFGDGESSDQAAPQHTYRKAGSYPVTVAVIAPSGEKSVSPVATVSVDSCLGSNLGRGWCIQSGSVQNFDGSLLVAPASVTTKHLRSVAAIGPDIAWIVGDGGTILRTKDGGNSWVHQHGFGQRDLTSISAVSADIAWVVGDNGVVLKTIDGGEHWEYWFIENGPRLISVSAVDANTAWLLGSDAVAIRTVNGGESWSIFQRYPNFGQKFDPNSSPVVPSWYDLYFILGINAQTALILATGQDAFDYGKVWTKQFGTIDGGNTWNATVAYRPFSVPDGGYYFTPADQHIAWRYSKSQSYIGRPFPSIDKTIDAGKTWRAQTPGGLIINSAMAVNQQIVWAVGDNGLILRTETGGE